jgi:hypothetical protein
MKHSVETSGYYLIENSHDDWTFRAGQFAFRGTFKKVVTFAIIRYGFRADDIDIAIKEMIKHGNDAIHFGIYKTFIFTFNQKDRKVA